MPRSWSCRAAILLAGALAAGAAADLSAAQPGAKPLRIVFSDNPDKPTDPRTDLRLRPNVQQAFYLYVENTSDKPAEATVELLANGQPLGVEPQKVQVEARGFRRVVFAKPAPPAPAAPDKPAAAPAPADKPPALMELPGPLQVRLVDDKKQVLDETEVRLARPDEYVTVKSIQFDPGRRSLTVVLEAKPEFAGPRARAELVLRPDRIPALAPGQKKQGSYGGYLDRAGDTLVLEATNLQLVSGGDANGLIYLTIDGYERAFTFRSNFPGDQPSEPRRIDDAILRLNAAPAAVPGAPSKVGVEVDNATADTVAELGLYRDDRFEQLEGELLQFRGDRRVRMSFSPAGPNGALLFKPAVEDWTTDLETAEIYGPRRLRLRLVQIGKDDQGKPVRREVPFFDSGKPIVVLDGKVEKTTSIVAGLMLDATKPEGVQFINFPAKLPRGAVLPVRALGSDPESGIKQVVFFGGRPLPDGKLPPGTTPVAGERVDKDQWGASLPVATDKKGPVEVTVQFTNGAGLTTTETVVIQLVDPPAEAKEKGKGASIAGSVSEGDRPQPNLPVWLFDDKSAVRDMVRTDDWGQFLFKDVPPGSYRVVATKSGSNTRGEVAAQVAEGQQKTGVDVRMVR
jgi:hypothetical protein